MSFESRWSSSKVVPEYNQLECLAQTHILRVEIVLYQEKQITSLTVALGLVLSQLFRSPWTPFAPLHKYSFGSPLSV